MTEIDDVAWDRSRRRHVRRVLQGPTVRRPTVTEPLVRLVTVLNGAFLAAVVTTILFGGVAGASLGDNELNLPSSMLWAWVAALPGSLLLALVLNRRTGWSWARHVNGTIGVLWAASLPFLWSGGMLPGL